jgi:hypothetical protein
MELYYIVYYLIFTAASVGFLKLSEVSRAESHRASYIFFGISELIFVLDGFTRGDRGMDTVVYRAHFESLEYIENSIESIVTNSHIFDFEYGYVAAAYIASTVGLNFDGFNLILSGFLYGLLILIADGEKIKRSNLILLFILSGFLFSSYNGVRQIFALLLTYYAIGQFAFKFVRRSVISLLLAVSMHLSSLFFYLISVMFSIYIGSRKSMRIVIGVSLMILVVTIVGTEFNYESYVNPYARYTSRIVAGSAKGIGYGYIVQSLINIISLYLLTKNRSSYDIYDHLNIIWVVMYTFFAYNAFLMRFVEYFHFAQLFVFVKCLENSYRRVPGIYYVYILLLLVSFVASIYLNAAGIVYGYR